MINHVLLEVFCRKSIDQVESPFPEHCVSRGSVASYQCLFNKCPFVDFTSCEDTLCYIGAESDEIFGISFGGMMEEGCDQISVEKWREISIAKIDEAYKQFIEMKSSDMPNVTKSTAKK